MTSNVERQRKFKAQMQQQGFAQVTGWVPAQHAAAVAIMLRQMRDNPHLEPAALRDPVSGRFVRSN